MVKTLKRFELCFSKDVRENLMALVNMGVVTSVLQGLFRFFSKYLPTISGPLTITNKKLNEQRHSFLIPNRLITV